METDIKNLETKVKNINKDMTYKQAESKKEKDQL